jgi:hypothetical protein
MATITEPVRTRDAAGIRARRVLQVAGPSSYATGGDPCTPNALFLGVGESIPSVTALDASGANPRLVVYDYVNEKFKWFVPNTGSEVANATDLSGYSFRIEVAGK